MKLQGFPVFFPVCLVTPRAGVWIETNASAASVALDAASLPVRECGLKHYSIVPFWYGTTVTPRAGVWIETCTGNRCRLSCHVTPRAGVWIETPNPAAFVYSSLVTPRAGVWIETRSKMPVRLFSLSLPVRECGLKLLSWLRISRMGKSLPVRECGLKHKRCLCTQILNTVTPRAGVWIETIKLQI